MAVSYVVSESHWRSASKGISYRLFATLLTTTVSFLMTGSYKTAAIIGTAEVSAKVLLYWAHERIWTRIRWGRHHEVIAADGPNQSPVATLTPSSAPKERAPGETVVALS